MGCDIHSVAQRLVGDKYEDIPGFSPFDDRSYGVFGFLANVRNYSQVPPISEPRGYPADYDPGDTSERHSASWLSVKELVEFDYEQKFRDMRSLDGGEVVSYRDFLRKPFFDDLDKLLFFGAHRVVFDFDN